MYLGMKSSNFEHIKAYHPALATFGEFAETYLYCDPVIALIRLRMLAEALVNDVYNKLKLERPYQASFNDLLNDDSLKRVIPRMILNKIHFIRREGNQAAHGQDVTIKTAIIALQESYDLCKWLYVSLYKGDPLSVGQFKLPDRESSPDKILEQNKKLKELLAQKDAETKALLEQVIKQQGIPENKTAQQYQEIFEHSLHVAEELGFNEDETRTRIIDVMLTEAGWTISKGQEHTGVTVEFKVEHQPTPSGVGYVDYVLWGDNGKPLAVIEAKRTSSSVEAGKQQARIYADALEKIFGQRPVIFYSNGLETYIWNDVQKEVPRRVYGIYSKDSLEYMVIQRTQRHDLLQIQPNLEIVDRPYQLQAVKSVCERFSLNYTKVLIVQATGTGKTRVAVALCDLMVRAGWVKRILFLCDRLELLKQAKHAFRDFLPNEPLAVVDTDVGNNKDKRVFLSTYPAMMGCYQKFDVGFFDLVISDESHRSIYNRYRDLFLYFDARQVGLTATPKNYITHDTYKMFNCEEDVPTFFFGYQEAIDHVPPYLCHYEALEHSTQFLRDGIRYKELSEAQRRELEDQLEDPEEVSIDKNELNKTIFNKDTNRAILKNLMENGIKNATGNASGKSIIFAINHAHAQHLEDLFNEMYPQYGSRFCALIDNTLGDRAQTLIDEFKDQNNPLTIAISVDMLDTGIDVPEIVNLVFAKSVKSHVKFWQMIGRGTRLCENLFGSGKHKEKFYIFDHGGNFTYFDEHPQQIKLNRQKSLLEKLFLARVNLVKTALEEKNTDVFHQILALVSQDIEALPLESISVKERLREIKMLQHGDTLKNFSLQVVHTLKNEIAPLMQWRNSKGQDEALSFDYLIAEAEIALLIGSDQFDNLKTNVIKMVSELPLNIHLVCAKKDTIDAVKTGDFWKYATVQHLEKVRLDLRNLMKYREKNDGMGNFKPIVIDITEDMGKIILTKITNKTSTLDLIAYRKHLQDVLLGLIDQSPVLQKIKHGERISQKDIDDITALVVSLHPDINLQQIAFIFPDTVGRVENLIRSIIGLSPDAVGKSFEAFIKEHPMLSSKQMKFLDLLKNYITKYGSIEVEKFYQPPFTMLDSNGLDGIFPDEVVVSDLFATFSPFLSGFTH